MDEREGIGGWLATLSDDELAGLIASRRDLLARPPLHLEDLASRLSGSSSVTSAAVDLDRGALQVAAVLAYLNGRATAAELSKVLALSGKVPKGHVDGALRRLSAVGLVWPVTGKAWRVVSGLTPMVVPLLELGIPISQLLTTATSPRSMPQLQRALDLLGLGRAHTGWEAVQRIAELVLSPAALESLMAAAPTEVQLLVERFAMDQPTTEADEDAAAWLADRCLLVMGQLPAELIRHQRAERVVARVWVEPALVVPAGEPHDGQDQVMSLLTDTRALLRELQVHPVKALADGGIGVQEQRRLAKVLGRDLARIRWVLQLCGSAELLSRGLDAGRLSTRGQAWLEQDDVDAALVILAAGLRQRVVGDELTGPVLDRSWRGATSGARLADLASLMTEPGTDPTLRPYLQWRRAGSTVAEIARAVELVHDLGLRAGGWPSPWLAPLLEEDHDAAAKALRDALPAEQDQLVLQADGTAFVAGRPSDGLRVFLDLIADRESDRTWRVSVDRVRDALTGGHSAAALLEELAERSAHAVPQVVSVLIEDLGARFGRIRVVPSSTLLSVDDEALVQELLSDRFLAPLELTLVQPGVLSTTARPEVVMRLLQQAGHAPRGPSVPAPELARITPQRVARLETASPTEIVGALRRTPSRPEPTQTVDNVDLPTVRWLLDAAPQLSQGEAIRLARAVTLGSRVRIDYLDSGGKRSTRDVQELTRQSQWLEGWCLLRNDERMFHPDRIQAVYPST